MPKQQEETHYLIATGGVLNDEIRVEKHKFTSRDEAFMDEYDDFGEYIDEQLENECAEYEQSFCRTFTISDDNIDNLIAMLIKVKNGK